MVRTDRNMQLVLTGLIKFVVVDGIHLSIFIEFCRCENCKLFNYVS